MLAAPRAAPPLRQTNPNRNAVNPGAILRSTLELLPLQKQPQEHLLGRIVCVLFVAQHTKTNPPYPRAEPLDQRHKGRSIGPFARGFKSQFFVGLGRYFQGESPNPMYPERPCAEFTFLVTSAGPRVTTNRIVGAKAAQNRYNRQNSHPLAKPQAEAMESETPSRVKRSECHRRVCETHHALKFIIKPLAITALASAPTCGVRR
jgi:hypothetical protein